MALNLPNQSFPNSPPQPILPNQSSLTSLQVLPYHSSLTSPPLPVLLPFLPNQSTSPSQPILSNQSTCLPLPVLPNQSTSPPLPLLPNHSSRTGQTCLTVPPDQRSCPGNGLSPPLSGRLCRWDSAKTHSSGHQSSTSPDKGQPERKPEPQAIGAGTKPTPPAASSQPGTSPRPFHKTSFSHS